MPHSTDEKPLSAEQGQANDEQREESKSTTEKETTENKEVPPEEEDEYPSKKVVLPAMAALYLTFFLIALDRTILGTAVPAISNEFQSFGDISWYEAGFLLPLCMFQLSFGRVYTYYSIKWILIAQVAVFELGSIVSATAPNSKALIVGRVITGLGGAGVSSAGLVIINQLVPLASRPKYSGGIGAVFGLSSILGPLLGGYLTSVTWRWCFWINLPIGGVSLVVLTFFLPRRAPALKAADTFIGKVKQLDPLGFILIAPSLVCLLFALQWGGVLYPWNSGRIIALFVVSGVLGAAFIGVQIWRGDKATIPPKIVRQRSILAGTFVALAIGSILVIYPFYLPIWFQTVQGKTPQDSGLSLLPLLLSNVLFVIITGILTSKLGYYTPSLILGTAILIVGSALITTWQVDISTGTWIGYQIVTGVGLGFSLQQAAIAAQTVLPKEQVPIGVTYISFVQFLGGTIFVPICQALLDNRLADNLVGRIPNLDVGSIANQGATYLRSHVSPEDLPFVLQAYNDSIRSIWYVGLALSCLAFLASFGMEWVSVKKNENKMGGSVVPADAA